MTRGRDIPIVSVVGKSDSGKTTLLEKLIRALSARGYRVGTVKHHVHDFEIDVPGKDSWRHARAGAQVTLVSSPSKLGMIRRMDSELTLPELAELAGDVDILLTEGFKSTARVRIEISRAARSTELISAADELFAVVTDNAEVVPAGVPAFGLEDTDALVDLVEREFLASRPAPKSGEVPDGD